MGQYKVIQVTPIHRHSLIGIATSTDNLARSTKKNVSLKCLESSRAKAANTQTTGNLLTNVMFFVQ
jgi:hypothetical protein